MAKRFTDSDKWKDRWFRRLDPFHKLIWIYFLDNCNNAGILEIDPEAIEFNIGCGELDWTEILDVFGDKVIRAEQNGDKFFIPKFIEFQYGELNPNVKAHLSAINILKKYTVCKGFINCLQTVKDKDKNKDKDKDKNKDKEKDKKTTAPKKQFPEPWEATDTHIELANKHGKDLATEMQKFKDYCLANGKKYANYDLAFNNWLRPKQWD